MPAMATDGITHACLQVNSQHNQRTFHFADQTVQNNVWQMYDEEKIPKFKQAKIRTRKAEELYNLTKDKTDYVWYTTRYVSMVSCFDHLLGKYNEAPPVCSMQWRCRVSVVLSECR